jgi:hypothetical protein
MGVVRHGWNAALGAAVIAAALLHVGQDAAFAAPSAGSATSDEISLASCGEPGMAPCPLQRWMRSAIATPLASNDAATLAAGLDRTARLSPDPSWASWASFASEGAAAARRGDITAARASCKGCHDAWREKYRAAYRARPLPR